MFASVCFNEEEGFDTVQGLFPVPQEEDPPNTFYLGYIGWNGGPTDCKDLCEKEPNCMSYTFYANNHPELVWRGECLGRSNFKEIRVHNDYATSGSRTVCSCE